VFFRRLGDPDGHFQASWRALGGSASLDPQFLAIFVLIGIPKYCAHFKSSPEVHSQVRTKYSAKCLIKGTNDTGVVMYPLYKSGIPPSTWAFVLIEPCSLRSHPSIHCNGRTLPAARYH
jgi:hypothetical protein